MRNELTAARLRLQAYELTRGRESINAMQMALRRLRSVNSMDSLTAQDHGLGGSVWTADPSRGESFARRVRSGTIAVNCYTNDPFAPFGGVRSSELGPEGLVAFQSLKTIYLDEANDGS